MYLLDKIIKYKRKTLNDSLKEVMKSKNKMISGKYSPGVFNLDYEEISYKSIDGVSLYGWLIRAKKADKTIILCHGRGVNRVFCVKFLKIFIEHNLIKNYNIFIPDFRNSGKSDIAKTGFGYFFAKDIFSTLKMLKNKINCSEFVLYGFSQGAIAAAITSTIYKEELKELSINIDKLILDSPVSNVKKIIIKNAKFMKIPIPLFIIKGVLFEFNKFVEYNLDIMQISKLIKDIPVLILQSKKDTVTPFNYLVDEYEKLSEAVKDKVRFKSFFKGEHVRLYLQYKEEYAKTVCDFLKEGENNE